MPTPVFSPEIVGIRPFPVKRILVVPHETGELTLYVMDGRAYPFRPSHEPTRRAIDDIHFGGTSSEFHNPRLDIPEEKIAFTPEPTMYCELEAVFRFVRSRTRGYVPEVVAVSSDECKTFAPNVNATLARELNRRAL